MPEISRSNEIKQSMPLCIEFKGRKEVLDIDRKLR
jgi:hypothetical protein